MRERQMWTRTLLTVGTIGFLLVGAGVAVAAINAQTDGDALAGSLEGDEIVTGGSLEVLPPEGSPTAVADTDLALFPLDGPDYLVLSSGDATEADAPNDSDSRSTDNGAQNSAAGPGVYDQVTLRVDVDVPAEANCLTLDYRFLTEEFDEYVNSEFNDAFLAQLDTSGFTLQDDGTVIASDNFAVGPDGNPTTVKGTGTSADNALGTTYDGGSPVLRATTPITPGAHSIYLTVYDAADAIYDSTVFVDNIRARDVAAKRCKLGSAGTPSEDVLCAGLEPTVFPVNGLAKGTNGDDVILGSTGDDVIRGRGGNDTICARSGVDDVRGDAGDDLIKGGPDDDVLRGGPGDDVLRGARGRDTLRGQDGNDRLVGAKQRDLLYGGADGDALSGGNAKDRLFGRRGDDVLRGGKAPDNLRGGPGTDRCTGGEGNDVRSGCES